MKVIDPASVTEGHFTQYDNSITSLPIFVDEEGDYWGYGHIDPTEFVAAVSSICYVDHGDSFEAVTGRTKDETVEDVRHYYAFGYIPDEVVWHMEEYGVDLEDVDLDNVALRLCGKSTPGAFPVTVLQFI